MKKAPQVRRNIACGNAAERSTTYQLAATQQSELMLQSLSQMLIHLVFSTKHCQPFINEKIEPELYAYIAKILYDECYSPALIIGGDKDHIHIVYAQSRVWSVAKIVELIKKRSSKWMKTKGNDLRSFSGKPNTELSL